jgi:hypothetical protein
VRRILVVSYTNRINESPKSNKGQDGSVMRTQLKLIVALMDKYTAIHGNKIQPMIRLECFNLEFSISQPSFRLHRQ